MQSTTFFATKIDCASGKMQPLPLFEAAVLQLRPQIAHNLAVSDEIRAAPAASYLRIVPQDVRNIVLQHLADTRIHAKEYIAEARRNFAQFCKLYALPADYSREYANQYMFSAAALQRDYPNLIVDHGMVVIKFINGRVLQLPPYWLKLHAGLDRIGGQFMLHSMLPCGLVYASTIDDHYLVDFEGGNYIRIGDQRPSNDYVLDDYGNKQWVHGNDEKILQLGRPSCYSATIRIM